jgi:hypothetical protein
MPPLFVTVSDVDAWRGKPTEQEYQPALESAIASAVSWVERAGGRRSLDKKRITVTIDGHSAAGSPNLWLPRDLRPVWHVEDTDDVVEIVEDGSALTVAGGYSASADVRISGVNEDSPVLLYRCGGWSCDRQNIVVELTVGWDGTPPDAEGVLPEILPMPASIRQLVIETAWLTFNSAEWVGRQNVSKAGAAITISNSLSPMAADTLANLRGL